MLFLVKIVGILPLDFLYFIGNALSYPARWFYRGDVVFANLRIAFPEKSNREIRQIRKKFYKNFLQVVVEVVKTSTISKKDLSKRVRLVNPEVLENEYENGNSILIFASHFCNWEWSAHAVTLQTSYTLDPVYKVQSNPQLDQFIYKIRSRFGGEPIPKENTARNILRNKDKKRAIGFVADQKPYRKAARVWFKFFNNETAFFRGGILLPYMSQFPCYYMRVTRVKKGFYELEAVKIGKPEFQKNDPRVMRNYINEVEKQIETHPADWLWSHKRWAKKRQEDESIYE